MSRAFEESLAHQLVRLEQWISESQTLASRSSDEETLLKLEADLTRWRESRSQIESRLRRTKSVNRFASWVLVTFCISFAALFGIALLGVESTRARLFVAIDVLLLLGCGTMYVVAVVVRDVVAQGRQPWRFSLRSLLVVTTVVAVILALLAYEFRK